MARLRGLNTYLEWDRGFRGWLVAWFITAVLALIAQAVNLLRTGRTGAVWWSAVGAKAWVFKAVLVVDAVWGVGVFVALVYGITLFLREDRATPQFWVRFYIVLTILGTAIYILHAYRLAVWRESSVRTVLVGWGWRGAASAFLLPLVWAVYWMRSKRVKNTYGTASPAQYAGMATLTRADLGSIHQFSGRNRNLLARSAQAGCFYCQSLFDPAEIMAWVDGRQLETGEMADGVTALCPRCGIDAVLPSAAVSLRAEMLTQMNAHWFSAQ